MTTHNSCQGQLLAANPVNPHDELSKAVILILSHTAHRAIGIQINQPMLNLTFESVAHGMGMDYQGDDIVWNGGSAAPTKIHVVHSLDWSSLSTVRINNDIGITSDVSVIAALSAGRGPEHFRACSGFWIWDDNHLDRMLDPETDEVYRWELSPATLESVFQGGGTIQWLAVLDESAQMQIAGWF